MTTKKRLNYAEQLSSLDNLQMLIALIKQDKKNEKKPLVQELSESKEGSELEEDKEEDEGYQLQNLASLGNFKRQKIDESQLDQNLWTEQVSSDHQLKKKKAVKSRSNVSNENQILTEESH